MTVGSNVYVGCWIQSPPYLDPGFCKFSFNVGEGRDFQGGIRPIECFRRFDRQPLTPADLDTNQQPLTGYVWLPVVAINPDGTVDLEVAGTTIQAQADHLWEDAAT